MQDLTKHPYFFLSSMTVHGSASASIELFLSLLHPLELISLPEWQLTPPMASLPWTSHRNPRQSFTFWDWYCRAVWQLHHFTVSFHHSEVGVKTCFSAAAFHSWTTKCEVELSELKVIIGKDPWDHQIQLNAFICKLQQQKCDTSHRYRACSLLLPTCYTSCTK